MKQHPNFYENLKEANMRLRGSVILYDGEPYTVRCITNHKPDGIFRIYLLPIDYDKNLPPDSIVPSLGGFPGNDSPGMGEYIDQWMTEHPKSPLIRKMMNSPKFNKFRPFPLGMCNVGTKAYYLQRQPQRKTEQGLTQSALSGVQVSLKIRTGAEPVDPYRGCPVEMFSKPFADCVKGLYPSAEDCLKNLLDPEITNEAVAFHREFAFVRGPMGMLFLAYKEDIVGMVSKGDLSELRLGKGMEYAREAISDLNLFSTIV